MKTRLFSVALLMGAALGTGNAFAQATATVPAEAKTVDAGKKMHKRAKETADSAKATPEAKKPMKNGPVMNASAADIADAKAKGLVWVNTKSRVYHKDGDFYGATKEGKFMTEAEALKAGHHAAKHGGAHKAAAAAAAKK